MKIKSLVTISLLIFGLVFAGVLIFGSLAKPTSGSNPQTVVPSGPAMTLSPDVVAKHNSATDCWLIINHKVYDITQFLPSHPGGEGRIVRYCGGEATQAFNTKDRSFSSGHSPLAASLLADFYLGDLGQTINGK